MSKYTTEVRYLCEFEAGYKESQGYQSIDEIVTKAAPKIFDFDFPIFDADYRLPLEKKILKHFYTREISEETVGLWKLRLEDRLNLIMPYYNKLYESELLEFNPLYDADYSKTGQNELNGETSDRLIAIEKHENENIRTLDTETVEDTQTTDNNTRTLNTQTVEDTETTDANTRTLNTRSEEDTETTDANTRTLNTTKSEEVDTTDNNTRTLNTTKTEDTEINDDNTRTLNTSRVEDTDTTDANTRTFNTTDAESGSDIRKNDRWDLYSDTPQGGINGITADSDSVANNTYLTDARHIIDDGTGSTRSNTLNKTGTIGDSGSGTKDTTVRDTGTIVDDRTQTTDSSIRDTGTIADVGTGSKDSEVRETGTIGDSGTGTKDSVVSETGTIGDSGSGTKDSTVSESGTIGDAGTGSKDSTISQSGNITDNESKQRDLTENKNGTVNNLNEYSEHVLGKMSSVSYSKLLKEFRETFLKIDAMLMEELEPLFFGLWM